MLNKIIEEITKNEQEIIENRRLVHSYAEVGFDLDKTITLICEQLKQYGVEYQLVGKAGVSCLIGQPTGKTILLRADMDSLTMPEDNDLIFQSKNNNAHMCGHDAHTAMLLGAARYLKEHEQELKGYVKLMFQPAEEQLAGAQDMIENGILENPEVDCALGLHVMTGNHESKTNTVYTRPGSLNYSGDALKVVVYGKEAHGSQTYLGVDAIVVASSIVLALQNIVAKELEPTNPAVVLVGKIRGGTAVNTVADKVEMEISIRATKQETREYLQKRIAEISGNIALSYQAKAEFSHVYGVPSLVNNKELTQEIISYSQQLLGKEHVKELVELQGSEDFCLIANKIPSTYLFLGAGSPEEGYSYGPHHSKMKIDEATFKIGSAIYVNSAIEYLKNHSQ